MIVARFAGGESCKASERCPNGRSDQRAEELPEGVYLVQGEPSIYNEGRGLVQTMDGQMKEVGIRCLICRLWSIGLEVRRRSDGERLDAFWRKEGDAFAVYYGSGSGYSERVEREEFPSAEAFWSEFQLDWE